MFEFSISKDIKFMLRMKGAGNREDGNTFISSNINCKGIEN
jgi:hypothetical protein